MRVLLLLLIVVLWTTPALAQFPVELTGPTGEAKTATITLAVLPPLDGPISVLLSVQDPDYPNEGELWVNGNGPLPLFGAQGTSANDNKVAQVVLPTPRNWWRVGANELRFVHTRTSGFSIVSASVATADDAPPPPPTALRAVIQGGIQIETETGVKWARFTAVNPTGKTCQVGTAAELLPLTDAEFLTRVQGFADLVWRTQGAKACE